MRDIVINTGPVIGLVAAVGSIEWLPRLYNRVLIPNEVYREIDAGGSGNPEILAVDAIASEIDIEQESRDLPIDLLCELDRGEASVIQAAKIRKIQTVAIDEKAGRRLARIHGLKVTGSLGILIEANKQGMISDLSDCVARMRQCGIWISADLEIEFLRQASV